THRQSSLLNHLLHARWKLEQPERVRDRRALTSDLLRDLGLCQAEVLDQGEIGARLLDGVEILALDVLDERHFEQPILGDLTDDRRHLEQARALSGPPSAFTGHDPVARVDTPE